MSLTVRMSATASAIWPSRCSGCRSVLRRSWPKLESQELVRSTGHRRPRVSGFLTLVSPLRCFLAKTMSVSPRLWQRSVVVAFVAAVQVQGLDVWE